MLTSSRPLSGRYEQPKLRQFGAEHRGDRFARDDPEAGELAGSYQAAR
jgi:hypothetical protein